MMSRLTVSRGSQLSSLIHPYEGFLCCNLCDRKLEVKGGFFFDSASDFARLCESS
jgi:hypothetical protein